MAAWLVALFAIALSHRKGTTPQRPPSTAEAQEHGGRRNGHEAEDDEEGPGIVWKWANFAILAGGLGYLISQKRRTVFRRAHPADPQGHGRFPRARKQAEARAAEIDRRLAALGARSPPSAPTQREAQAETERLARHTAAEIAKVQAHAEQEIVSAGKAARTDLKRYSAELAIDLAETAPARPA